MNSKGPTEGLGAPGLPTRPPVQLHKRRKKGQKVPGPSAQEGGCLQGGEEGVASIDLPHRIALPVAAKTWGYKVMEIRMFHVDDTPLS